MKVKKLFKQLDFIREEDSTTLTYKRTRFLKCANKNDNRDKIKEVVVLQFDRALCSVTMWAIYNDNDYGMLPSFSSTLIKVINKQIKELKKLDNGQKVKI